MASTRLEGGEGWRRDYAGAGTRVLFTNNTSFGTRSNEGVVWNNDASYNIDNMLDIGGAPTEVGVKVITAFAGSSTAGTLTDDFGYADTSGSAAVWESPRYTTGTSAIELFGFHVNDSVDLAIAGVRTGSGDRGGLYRLVEDGREAEVQSYENAGGMTGPIIFKGIAPVNGSITIQFVTVSSYLYFSFLDILVKRR